MLAGYLFFFVLGFPGSIFETEEITGYPDSTAL
jgi:hypothetical protein